MVFAFVRRFVHEGGALMHGITDLLKETHRDLSLLLPRENAGKRWSSVNQ